MMQINKTIAGVLLGWLWLVAAAVAEETAKPAYLLGAGDMIRIQVFQNPDLQLETRIGDDGAVSYPLLGQVWLGGKTVGVAENLIAAALKKGGFVLQPQVTITPIEFRGNQVSALGFFNRPGRFALDKENIALSELVALAGGLAASSGDDLVVSGTRAGKPFRAVVDFEQIFRSDDGVSGQLRVRAGDTVYAAKAPSFYIYGETQRPGAYRIERGMTLRQALALGGGPTARGTERGLTVERRAPDGQLVRLKPALSEAVRDQDVLYVSESLF